MDWITLIHTEQYYYLGRAIIICNAAATCHVPSRAAAAARDSERERRRTMEGGGEG